MLLTPCSSLKGLLVLGVIALLLAGCSMPLGAAESEASALDEPLGAQPLSLEPNITIDVILYFPNRSRTRLTAEPRQLVLSQNEAPAAAIVAAMLAGPQNAELRPVGSGLSLERVEVTTEVINVYLLGEPEGSAVSADLTAGKLAIATTLIDYAAVRCVNVLLNGVQTAFEDPAAGLSVPTGALTRVTDLAEELNALEQRAAAPSPDLYAVLYFVDPSEKFLLPEMQRIQFPAEADLVSTLVSCLQQGPENSYNYQPVLEPSAELLSCSLAENGDGTSTARLVFSRNPALPVGQYRADNRLALGALTCTICDFVPNVSAVEVHSRTRPLEAVVCRPPEFADLLGCRVQVCLPNTPTGVTMSAVERVLPQEQASDPRALLQAVFEGPVGTDSRNVWPAVPDGISMEDVLNVYVAGDILVVDFSQTVVDVLELVAPEDERTMLFAIINTLTSFESVRRVQFLVEGERRDYLGAQTLCVLDPLMKNPGIVK